MSMSGGTAPEPSVELRLRYRPSIDELIGSADWGPQEADDEVREERQKDGSRFFWRRSARRSGTGDDREVVSHFLIPRVRKRSARAWQEVGLERLGHEVDAVLSTSGERSLRSLADPQLHMSGTDRVLFVHPEVLTRTDSTGDAQPARRPVESAQLVAVLRDLRTGLQRLDPGDPEAMVRLSHLGKLLYVALDALESRGEVPSTLGMECAEMVQGGLGLTRSEIDGLRAGFEALATDAGLATALTELGRVARSLRGGLDA